MGDNTCSVINIWPEMGCAKSRPVCCCDMPRLSSRPCSTKKYNSVRKRTSFKCKEKRPPGPYALFLKSMKSCYSGDLVTFSRMVSNKWRNLDAKKKAVFERRSQYLKTKYPSLCKNSSCSKYLNFVNAAYRCLRQQHPDWSSKQIRAAVMDSYRSNKCPC